MKKIITMFAVAIVAVFGLSNTAEARKKGGSSHKGISSTVYISGYHYGRPIYTEKYFVGYDCWGRPVFKYRTVSAPRRHCNNTQYHSPPVTIYEYNHYTPSRYNTYSRQGYCR